MPEWKGIPIVTDPYWPVDFGPGFLTTRDAMTVVHFYAPDCDYVTAYLTGVSGGGEVHVRHYGERFRAVRP